MLKKLNLAAVPYLNALPLYEGLEEFLPQAHLIFQSPHQVSQSLRSGRADVGLVPIISLLDPGMHDFVALPDLRIACRGEVLSVYVASKIPLEKITQVYLDPESRSSAALLHILAAQVFPQKIRFLSTVPGYEKEIKGNRAGLIIGDRALSLREVYPYRLDLGQAWEHYTNYPFTFALWAIRRNRLSDSIVEGIRQAAKLGQRRLHEIASLWTRSYDDPNVSFAQANRYLQEHIHYQIGPEEHAGIKRFLHLAVAHNMINPQREIAYYDTSSHYRSGIGGKEFRRPTSANTL